MSGVKLSRGETITLIKAFENSECLWNMNNPAYKQTRLKILAWHRIAQAFGHDVEQIKKKIKYLRTSYVAEKKKVDFFYKNKNDGAYEPNLFYFKEMGFLDDVIVQRKRISENTMYDENALDIDSNMSFSRNIKADAEHWDESTNISDQAESYISLESNKLRKDPQKTSETKSIKSELNDWDEININTTDQEEDYGAYEKKQKRAEHSKPENSVEQFNASTCTNSFKNYTHQTDDMFTLFGGSIVAQLKTLPLENASRAMARIQNIVTEEIIASLNLKKEFSEPQSSGDLNRDMI